MLGCRGNSLLLTYPSLTGQLQQSHRLFPYDVTSVYLHVVVGICSCPQHGSALLESKAKRSERRKDEDTVQGNSYLPWCILSVNIFKSLPLLCFVSFFLLFLCLSIVSRLGVSLARKISPPIRRIVLILPLITYAKQSPFSPDQAP